MLLRERGRHRGGTVPGHLGSGKCGRAGRRTRRRQSEAGSGSSSPAVKALSYQTVVELRVDEVDTVYSEGSRWWPVQIDGLVGWVAGQYLAPAESTWTEPEGRGWKFPRALESRGLVRGRSYVLADTDDGSGLNIRADGAPDAERIGIVPENDVVQVMDGPYNDPIGNPWYLITDGEVTGFVSGWYLSRADQPGEDLANRDPLEGDDSRCGHRARSTIRSVLGLHAVLRLQSLLVRTLGLGGRL